MELSELLPVFLVWSALMQDNFLTKHRNLTRMLVTKSARTELQPGSLKIVKNIFKDILYCFQSFIVLSLGVSIFYAVNVFCMWFFAFTFCWIYDRSAIAANNFIALLCYSTGRAFEVRRAQTNQRLITSILFGNKRRFWAIQRLSSLWNSSLLGLKKVIIVSGPIFFIVTASLGWRYAFTDPLMD